MLSGTAIAGALACTTGTTSTPIAPIAGIVVRAESVIPSGACGDGDKQLSRYVAVLRCVDGPSEVVTMGLFPCYADAYFVALTGSRYDIDVYVLGASMEHAAYVGTDPEFQPSLGLCDAGAADADAADADASKPDAGPCWHVRTNADVITAYARANNLAGILTFSIAARLQCSATSQADLQVVAACVPAVTDASTDADEAGDSAGSSDAHADADAPDAD